MVDDARGWHRHIELINGRAKLAQVYPPKLVQAILWTIRNKILETSAVSAVELDAGGPTAEQPELWQEVDYETYWDDVNGGFLDTKMTRDARKLELDWIMKEKVYSYRLRKEADDKGVKPTELLWIDSNKGDLKNPFVRSRLCVRECTKGKRAKHKSLEPEQLFSAMPPLEALKLMLSLKSSKKKSRKGKTYLMAHFDISRAHFMPKAEREIYVELPNEDPMKAQGYVGILERSMYGTQDASNLWQKDYSELISEDGYVSGKSNPALFYSKELDARLLVHGDDFVMLGDAEAIDQMHKKLSSKYEVKMLAKFGDEEEEQETVILNRIIRYVPASLGNKMRMEIEADARHVEVLCADLGLSASTSKGVDTPRVKRSESEVFEGRESPELDRQGVRLFRSGSMRLSYLGQDRSDVQEAAKCLAQRMKDPNEYDLAELKRAARYLMRYPRVVLQFEEQDMPKDMDGWVDSDYAGDVVTRKSTSGMVVMFGRHCLKTSSTVQAPIGLSSGEAEYYACVKGGATLLGMRALMEDWGLTTNGVLKLKTDSSAAKGFASRRGLGKQRHVSTRYLWLQAKVSSGDLKIEKVGTADQLADYLTKAIARSWIEEKAAELGLDFREGKAMKQKGALLQKTEE